MGVSGKEKVLGEAYIAEMQAWNRFLRKRPISSRT